MEEQEHPIQAVPIHIVKRKRTMRQRVELSTWSPTTSSDDQFRSTDEEEEEMANCLILLAQGIKRGKPNSPTTCKFISKRFVGDAHVYVCKTCNRTFPSFQALGGHRASHRKPKGVIYADESKQQHQRCSASTSSDEEERPHHRCVSPLSLQVVAKIKVHECSICGAKFSSGQALGGHMRRHRAPVGTSGNPVSLDRYVEEVIEERNVFSLDLDLNLPAPREDNQNQQQRQSCLLFATNAMVDCHY